MMTTKWTDAQKEHLKDLIAKNPNMSVREIALKFIEEDPTRTVEAVKSKFREMQKQEKETAQVEPVVEIPVPEETPEVPVEKISEEPQDEQKVQEPTPENPAVEHLTEAVVEPTPEVQAPEETKEEVKPETTEVVTETPKESLITKIINWLFK